MTYELVLGLALFSLVSSITPGPNNLMLMASGANFGFRRTIPHLLGVALGFTLMVLLVGVGLVQVFNAVPVSYQILKIVSVIYLLYLAWKIGTAAQLEGEAGTVGTPFTFLQAALFQWVNPEGLDDGPDGCQRVFTVSECCGHDLCCRGVWHHKFALRQPLGHPGSAAAAYSYQPDKTACF
jgi:hypothetical protein